MEFTPKLFAKVSKILDSYNGFIKKGMVLESMGITDCQVIFARKNIGIVSSGKLDLYNNSANDTGFASYIVFREGGKNINVLNVHGKSRPGHKKDTLARLNQSKRIIDFFENMIGPKIVGGDFNLNPDTKSIAMFEKAGYKNLIKDFEIKNTRNKISWKQFDNVQHFADYVFVSPDVKVKKFEVPYNEISDHLPQILEFEI